MIGLSYNNDVLNQYLNDPNISSIIECVDGTGRKIEQSVARDTYRCFELEKMYPDVKVFTVNKCEDMLRSCDNITDPYNINCNVCTNQFIKLLKLKSWKFNEIYVDTIRMNKSYVEHNFGKNFFTKLIEMKRSNILIDTADKSAKIYLPFNAHFFHMINSNITITYYFDVSYLKESEIGYGNHKLGFLTSNNFDYNCINKSLEEENRHITTTKKEILNHDIGFMMTKEKCHCLISKLDVIEEIRYIVLRNKIRAELNINTVNPYSYFLVDSSTNKSVDIKSCVVTSVNRNELTSLARYILRTLIVNPINSLLGISIVADAPQCRNMNLNVKRPGVLRQYYGLDIEKIDKDTVRRVSYRSQTSFQSEGSDPHKLVIKPFLDDMVEMAEYFNTFLNKNKYELNLENVDLSNNFNTCTLLLYHTLADIKKESSMGWHCDSRYSVSGNFSAKLNGQMYNTPVVIFTIGKSRLLKWRKRFTIRNPNGHGSFEIEKGFEIEMLLQEGNFLILNPKDEEPHYDVTSKKIIFNTEIQK